MQVEFAFLCDVATEAGGKLNALGVGIDRLMVSELPMTHRRLTVVTRIAFDRQDAGPRQFTIQLVGPDGVEVAPAVRGEMQVQVEDEANGTRANMIIEIANAQFSSVGPHEAKLTMDGTELLALPLEVIVREG